MKKASHEEGRPRIIPNTEAIDLMGTKNTLSYATEMVMTKQKYPPRIMYIECKSGLHGSARIGRITFSRTGATLHYGNRSFQSLKGRGFKANYIEIETGEEYWISGPRRDGTDRLYKSDWPVEIDEDVREEYWTEIRKRPEWKTRTQGSLSTTNRPNATSLTRV